MPVTAKLSRKFYDTFGDEIANELVEWFNQVDATYRGDLREINELNFARFDAKFEQRFARIDQRFEQVDERFAQVDQRFDQVDQRFAQVDQRFAQVDQRFAQVDKRFVELEGRLLTAMQEMKAELLKWMFGTIFAAWATLLGAMIALARLG